LETLLSIRDQEKFELERSLEQSFTQSKVTQSDLEDEIRKLKSEVFLGTKKIEEIKKQQLFQFNQEKKVKKEGKEFERENESSEIRKENEELSQRLQKLQSELSVARDDNLQLEKIFNQATNEILEKARIVENELTEAKSIIQRRKEYQIDEELRNIYEYNIPQSITEDSFVCIESPSLFLLQPSACMEIRTSSNTMEIRSSSNTMEIRSSSHTMESEEDGQMRSSYSVESDHNLSVISSLKLQNSRVTKLTLCLQKNMTVCDSFSLAQSSSLHFLLLTIRNY
jgi:hypothetical protein